MLHMYWRCGCPFGYRIHSSTSARKWSALRWMSSPSSCLEDLRQLHVELGQAECVDDLVTDPESGISFSYLTNGHDRHMVRQGRRGVAIASHAGVVTRA